MQKEKLKDHNFILQKIYKDNSSIEELRGEINKRTVQQINKHKAQMREKDDCLLKLFSEKQQIEDEYIELKKALEYEIKKVVESLEIKEKVAKVLRKDAKGDFN